MHNLAIPIFINISILIGSTFLFTNSASALVNDNNMINFNAKLSIPVDKKPIGIAVNPSNNKIYVANSGSDKVSVIDGKTNKVVSNLITGNNPQLLTLLPIGFNVVPILLVTNYESNDVSILFPSLKIPFQNSKNNNIEGGGTVGLKDVLDVNINKLILDKVAKISPLSIIK